MRVTVCQFRDAHQEADWTQLKAHVQTASSDLVLLPEMLFAPWFAAVETYDPAVWELAVAAHDTWLNRLGELGVELVLGSRPRQPGHKRVNSAFIWDSALRLVHDKYYLPEEDGFWEARWYERGSGDFTPARAGNALVGFQICTDVWFTQHARAYGQQGVHIIAVPRATPKSTSDKWLMGGRATAVISGAYCLSSNRAGVHATGLEFSGLGWIIDPEGQVLATTTDNDPFVTVDIDLEVAKRAKQTYPRYVLD
jgi:N-carbamoylputrescine amidase